MVFISKFDFLRDLIGFKGIAFPSVMVYFTNSEQEVKFRRLISIFSELCGIILGVEFNILLDIVTATFVNVFLAFRIIVQNSHFSVRSGFLKYKDSDSNQ